MTVITDYTKRPAAQPMPALVGALRGVSIPAGFGSGMSGPGTSGRCATLAPVAAPTLAAAYGWSGLGSDAGIEPATRNRPTATRHLTRHLGSLTT